ncbi:MAG: cytochrome c-type biogenesis protein CcmH [Rhodospirillales bacterium]|nr:cytochrome c-type biogenesis protein CcmH [Rhodospirillales bacterium]
MRKLSIAVLALLLAAAPAAAVEPDEMLADPVLEQRAQELGKELRCLVCQNQSIEESNAELARDLRILLRQRLVAGDSDEEAKAWLVDRYGDYVLLNPPFKPATYVLWLGPLALAGIAGTAGVAYLRRRGRSVAEPPPPLSAAEQARLDAWRAQRGEPT